VVAEDAESTVDDDQHAVYGGIDAAYSRSVHGCANPLRTVDRAANLAANTAVDR
jgi:hypothetical protein